MGRVSIMRGWLCCKILQDTKHSVPHPMSWWNVLNGIPFLDSITRLTLTELCNGDGRVVKALDWV